MTIKQVKIYDMDGTIVCSMHRYRTKSNNGKVAIDLQYWRDNQYKANLDSLLPLATQYQNELNNPEIYVIIATARELYQPDIDFINNILGKPNYVISRKHGDNISGKNLKINGLKKFFNLKNFKNATFGNFSTFSRKNS